jgi:hypothetical protein
MIAKSSVLGAALLVLGLLTGEAVNAQGPPSRPGLSPRARPTFSPYLNLLRRGNSPAVNYYGQVRPELAFRKSIGGLSETQSEQGTRQSELGKRQENIEERQEAQEESARVAPTRRASGFFTHSRYFFTTQAPGAASRSTPTAAPRTAPQKFGR